MENTQKKVVSIIILVYNKAEYLDWCISSLIGKNIAKAEIIVVNDGSTGSTLQIAHMWADKYSSVIIVDKENAHQGSCINAGMQIATGKYVRMFDGDDFFKQVSLINILSCLKV